MAWKKYKDMSPEEKKESWSRFRKSAALKKKLAHAERTREHTSDHKLEYNAGGYCRHCSYGRDYS